MMLTLDMRERIAAQEPAFLRRLRLRARRRVLWMRALWASGSAPPAQGLAISDSDVDRILDSPERLRRAEHDFYRGNEEAQRLGCEIEDWDERTARDKLWIRLSGEFGLTPYEVDLLSLALAVETDPWWRRVCGYLHDDATASHATLWLAGGLFQWETEVRLGSECGLARWYLARPQETADSAWSAAAPWHADPHLLAWVLEGRPDDASLGSAAQIFSEPPHHTCLYPDTLAAMKELVEKIRLEDAEAVELALTAPDGAGKQTLAAQLCAALCCQMLAVDADSLLGGDTSPALAAERAVRVVRWARLSNAAVYWRGANRVDPRIWRSVHGRVPCTIWGMSAEAAWPAQSGIVRCAFTLPQLSQAERRRLWSQLAIGPAPRAVAEAPLLPAEIAAAALSAPAGPEAVNETCNALLYRSPGDLFSALPLPFIWEDIVLPPGLRAHLDELESQVRLRFAVLEDWGFERLTPLGRGISALFAGPSGTGKTMAAQVLARSLGLALRRVDLSAVINKYIGETEKRLKLVFDACERDNVILFFDEADALFGQRTQVKDAHDRFANIEINYLLQRMEQFDGLAILATNRKEDLDRAFLRRLRFIVDFLPPGPAERRVLWRKSLSGRTPEGQELLEDAIDWDGLANKLDLTGAAIKSAVLGAAFLARAQNSRIGMNHILAAVRREMSKQGRVLRPGDLEVFE
jgi:hypothetical protein